MRAKRPRQQVPHRCVNEVAHARHEDAGQERLRHEQKQVAVYGELLSDVAHLVRSEIPEAVGVLSIR